jgi:hypothetical protein
VHGADQPPALLQWAGGGPGRSRARGPCAGPARAAQPQRGACGTLAARAHSARSAAALVDATATDPECRRHFGRPLSDSESESAAAKGNMKRPAHHGRPGPDRPRRPDGGGCIAIGISTRAEFTTELKPYVQLRAHSSGNSSGNGNEVEMRAIAFDSDDRTAWSFQDEALTIVPTRSAVPTSRLSRPLAAPTRHPRVRRGPTGPPDISCCLSPGQQGDVKPAPVAASQRWPANPSKRNPKAATGTAAGTWLPALLRQLGCLRWAPAGNEGHRIAIPADLRSGLENNARRWTGLDDCIALLAGLGGVSAPHFLQDGRVHQLEVRRGTAMGLSIQQGPEPFHDTVARNPPRTP